MLKTLILALALTSCATFNPRTVQLDAHSIQFSDGDCSGTAIGPHTLLTAAHCLTAPLAGVDDRPAKARWFETDGHDHALIGVDRAFRTWTNRRAASYRGEHVTMVGDPADMRGIFRSGFVAGALGEVTLYQMPIFFGDSGAGIFDDAGDLVGVVSGIRVTTAKTGSIQFAFTFPLSFTAKQWAKVD